MKKPTVVFEQAFIPHYRVPFFTKLASRVNLIVVASTGRTADGTANVITPLPFRVLRIPEMQAGAGLHEGMLDLLIETRADAYISYRGPLEKIFLDSTLRRRLADLHLKTLWLGCDGYWAQHFQLEKYFRYLRFWRPRSVYYAVREIWAMRRVDGFLAYSSHTADYFSIVCGVPPEKITVVKNAVDISGFEEAAANRRIKNAPRDAQLIVYLGRLTPSKRPDLLVNALRHIRTEFPAARLLMIGEGSERLRLQILAQSEGVADYVQFAGGVYGDKALVDHLCRASLAVMPGLGGLGFNTLMAAALPIIYTRADGSEKDLITEGYNGWQFNGGLADLIKKLKQALSDPARLRRYGEHSRQRIMSEFKLDTMVDRYVEGITKALNIHHENY